MSIFKLIIFILGVICFIINISFLIFYRHYCSSDAIQVLFYINFGLIYCIYLFMLFMELPIKNKTINKFRRKCVGSCGICTLAIIFYAIFLFEIIILSFMIDYMGKYWKNCPFTINDDYNTHYKRRCELYNINTYSRFLNQYICSYNPYDNFKYEYKTSGKHSYKVPKKLTKKIKPDYVRCVKVKNLIPNNEIIALFNNEYENVDKYYCARTNKPKKNTSINDKDCNNKVKNVFIYILFGFNFLKTFFFTFYIGYLSKIKSKDDYYNYEYKRNYNFRNNNINNNRNDNNSNNNNVNYYASNNNNDNWNNKNNEFNSTKGSENINKNNNSSIGFANKETNNIFIGNNEENPFEDNLRGYPYNNKIDKNNNNSDNSKPFSTDMKNNEVQIKNPYDDNN